MRIIILFYILCNIYITVDGLRCYTCSISESETDQTCLTDPANAAGSPITECNKKYCSILRIDYRDPKGELSSMVRLCEDKPVFMNKVIEDATYRYYYRSCREDLCNSGTGWSNSVGIIKEKGGANVLYVPGIGL